MTKKYIFLISSILYLFGSVLGMDQVIDIIATTTLVYVHSILLYIRFCVKGEKTLKDVLLLSVLIVTLATAINNGIAGLFAILLYCVLWFVYGTVGKQPITEELIGYGSVIKIYYNSANVHTILIQSVLTIIFIAIYLSLNIEIANSIAI